MPSTEVLSAPLKEGSAPQEVLKIADSVPVVSNIFSGFVHGKPNQLRVFADWDSIEAHEAFQKSGAFPPFLESFRKIVPGDFTLWHVDFKPSTDILRKTQRAPVTEILTFYFTDMSPDDFAEKVFRFRDVLVQQPGFVEMALGVTHEEVPFDGEKGHPLVVLIGWDSEQNFQTFIHSEDYKQKSPARSLKEGVLRKAEMEIVRLEPFRT